MGRSLTESDLTSKRQAT